MQRDTKPETGKDEVSSGDEKKKAKRRRASISDEPSSEHADKKGKTPGDNLHQGDEPTSMETDLTAPESSTKEPAFSSLLQSTPPLGRPQGRRGGQIFDPSQMPKLVRSNEMTPEDLKEKQTEPAKEITPQTRRKIDELAETSPREEIASKRRNSKTFETVPDMLSPRRSSKDFTSDDSTQLSQAKKSDKPATPRKLSFEAEDNAEKIQAIKEKRKSSKEFGLPSEISLNTSSTTTTTTSTSLIQTELHEKAFKEAKQTMSSQLEKQEEQKFPVALSKALEVDEGDRVQNYEDILVKQGYTQLIHQSVAPNDIILQNDKVAAKTKDGGVANGVATYGELQGDVSGFQNARLFAGPDGLYLLNLRKILARPSPVTVPPIDDLADPKVFEKYSDGPLTIGIFLIENNHKKEYQLRVIPRSTTGHPGLALRSEGRQEPSCLVAAGEAFILDGKILMIDDKSGRFHHLLDGKNINQKAIMDSMLSAYYHPKYKDNCFCKATPDDTVVLYEALRRGFPYSLLDTDTKKRFSLAAMPADIQELNSKQKTEDQKVAGQNPRPTAGK